MEFGLCLGIFPFSMYCGKVIQAQHRLSPDLSLPVILVPLTIVTVSSKQVT